MSPTTLPNPPPFPIVHGAADDDGTTTRGGQPLSPFTVSTTRGFLPLADPPSRLPAAFAPLERLLRAMPVLRADGRPGLLAGEAGGVGAAVDGDGEGTPPLPDLSREVDRLARGDPALATALYRDYSFLASAYLLEPCESDPLTASRKE
jgi:indoleamine 2,3-dioxygenase